MRWWGRVSAAFFAAVVVVLLVPAVVSAATGSIEGEVSAEGGGPIAEVWACAYLVEGEDESCDFTGGDGLYALAGLTPGKYKVEFWPESTSPPYVGEFYDNKPFWEDADELDVKGGAATTGIDAELEEAATIEGEVRAASEGGPIGKVLVCAQRPALELEGCTVAGSDGTYRLSGIPAGEYTVQWIPAANVYNLLNQWYDHEVDLSKADFFSLVPGETKANIDADLEEGSEIQGTVYSAANGAPIRGIEVCALFFEEVLETWLPSRCGVTSTTGSYRLFGLWADSYRVSFSFELKEIFGEPFGNEDDGYLTQFYDHQPTLASASPLGLNPPEVRTGIDAHLQLAHPGPLPQPPVISPAFIKPKPRHRPPKRCRPGFRKKKVMGKRRCVKARKHRHKGKSKSSR